jgi:nicotinamidase-related amidase
MQNDFINGVLGSAEAVAIVDNVVDKINNFTGDIIATYDTHGENYMETLEGKNLPIPHCIKGTEGWKLNEKVQNSLNSKGYMAIEKPTFGSVELIQYIKEKYNANDIEIELVGLCTDICVVSNAILLKANFLETKVSVDANRCAGVTPESHNSALTTMKMCQVNVIG